MMQSQRDDFGGTSLSSQWTVYDGKATNGDSVWTPDNVSVRDGRLVLSGMGSTVGGLCWCGPNTPDYAFGNYEFRVRVDAGNGYIPVLLLWPDAEDWPIGGEIDMLEVPNGDRQEGNATLHYAADNQQFGRSAPADFTQWQTIRLEWRSDSIRVFYGGEEVLYTDDPAQIPQRSMHPVIQLDATIPGSFGEAADAQTPQPLNFEVDYVEFTPLAGISIAKGEREPMSLD